MNKPRPPEAQPWTQADHEDNVRRFQADSDRKLWDKLARKVGIRGRDFAAALGRMLDDRIAAALRAQPNSLVDQITDPTQAGLLRGAVVDLILDDLTELVTVLTSKGTKHDTRTKKTR